MIIVQERPYDKCMSGNPIYYELYSALADTNLDIYFEIRIKFCYAHTLAFAELVKFPVYPTDGIAKFDIKDFLDGKLKHDLPAFNVDEQDATVSPNQTGLFYIEFREILTAGSDPDWDTSESDYKKFVMKSGLNYFKYRGDNFWENYFDDNNPFLTWQRIGRLARKQDRMYLAFLNTAELPTFGEPPAEVVPAALWASAKAYYTDGTESARIYKEVLSNYQWGINFIPAGCDQWSLQALDGTKRIKKWEIRMYYTSAGDGTKTALNDPYYFEADNRNDYNGVVLQFRNSLGGIDAVLLRGVLETNQNYTYDEQASTFLNDYFDGEYIAPARIIANSKEKTLFKGDAGWTGKENQDRLRDMNLNRNGWWAISSKWWPINILSPSFKQKSSEDTKWQFPVEFSFAHEGDKFYTPATVDLGDRVFASNVCAAILSNLSFDIDTSGPTATVTVHFDYDPLTLPSFTYQVVGVHADPIEYDIADMPLVIEGLAKETNFDINLRPICSNGVKGRTFMGSFNTIGAGGGGGFGKAMFLINDSGGDVDITIDAVNPYSFATGINGNVTITNSGTLTNNSGITLKFKFLQSLPSTLVDEATLNNGDDYNFPADVSFYNYVKVTVP